jgi:hypothetical protein
VAADEFPQRSEQQVSEDASVRVFHDCLPPKWIFRDQGTKNDYGIDAEVELVTSEGTVRGDLAKVQLKGQASVNFNEEGIASVGGIKQSTLRYWLGLSRYANVIVAVTDNTAREAYFTPVFWEAAERLDGTDATRSIHFDRKWSLKTDVGRALFTLATLNRPWEAIRAHEDLLRSLPRTLRDFLWVFQADPWMTQDPSEIIERWLRLGRQLLGHRLKSEQEPLFDFEYWREKSEKRWGDSPMYGTLRSTYVETFAVVFPEMRRISMLVKKGAFFFAREAPEYLQLVQQTAMPEQVDYDGIAKFVQGTKIEMPR